MSEVIESLEHLTVKNHDEKPTNGSNRGKEGFNFVLAAEEAVSLEKNYILGICATSDPEFRIAAALSDYSCNVYTVGETLSKIATLKDNRASIVGIRFSPTHQNLLYCASSDGYIVLYDLRAKGRTVTQFRADDPAENGRIKNLCSFDIGPDERAMAGGTELIDGDSFILFWDARYPTSKTQSRKTLLGGYWESHTDDVTTLAFHPTRRDVLASGSTDGLVNIFDLTQPNEDSALMHSLNTESSVDRLGWLGQDKLWCGTHTNTLQLWECEGAEPYEKFDRDALASSQNEDPENCYLVKMHSEASTGSNFLLAGCSTSKRESLRCLTSRDNKLDVCCVLSENKQIVRDSWFHEKVTLDQYDGFVDMSTILTIRPSTIRHLVAGCHTSVERNQIAELMVIRKMARDMDQLLNINDCLVTGGESGIVSIWRREESASSRLNANSRLHPKMNKLKGRDKPHKAKPY